MHYTHNYSYGEIPHIGGYIHPHEMAPPEGSPSHQRFQHFGRTPSQKHASDSDSEYRKTQKHNEIEPDGRAMLRKISMLKAENRKLIEKWIT